MKKYGKILAYSPVLKQSSFNNSCSFGDGQKFQNFKSIQIYAKLFMHPTIGRIKNTLVNLKKDSIIYATIYYHVLFCRRSTSGSR